MCCIQMKFQTVAFSLRIHQNLVSYLRIFQVFLPTGKFSRIVILTQEPSKIFFEELSSNQSNFQYLSLTIESSRTQLSPHRLFSFPAIFQKMDTSFGLSTIASLSLGISMSMTGSGRAVIESLSATELGRPASSAGSIGRRRQSFQQLFPVGSMLGAPRTESARRPSFVAILQQMSAQNRLMERPGGASTSSKGKTHADAPRAGSSMDRVPEEQMETKKEDGDLRYTSDVRLERNPPEKRPEKKEEACNSGARDNREGK